jgi:hypothetical protein
MTSWTGHIANRRSARTLIQVSTRGLKGALKSELPPKSWTLVQQF